MDSLLARHLDAHAQWRAALDRELGAWALTLHRDGLLDAQAADLLDGLRRRLQADRVVVAVVGAGAHGRSELINALCFADTGRRLLPTSTATARATLCPIEIGYDGSEPLLALLPIETRLQPLPLDDLRRRTERWTRIRLDAASPARVAESLAEVMRTQVVPLDQARALGCWDDRRPDANPPLVADGLVEVPAWRHAVVNLPHPLLQHGLVVLDTPPLDGVGAEPELALTLLPAAQAVIVVFAADPGVGPTDLRMWREHLPAVASARYVVLNKMDRRLDVLQGVSALRAVVEREVDEAAAQLAWPADRVFPMSARQALQASFDGHRGLRVASGVAALDEALALELLPRRRDVLERAVREPLVSLQARLCSRLTDQRCQGAERRAELQALADAPPEALAERVAQACADSFDAERCATRLAALRGVQARMLRDVLQALSTDRLRDEVARLQSEAAQAGSPALLRADLRALCVRLQEQLAMAARRHDEIHATLAASYRQLNTDFGFALSAAAVPPLVRHARDLDVIERTFDASLLSGAPWRRAGTFSADAWSRVLLQRLRTVFDAAAADVELWNRTASAQLETQWRERRDARERRWQLLDGVGLELQSKGADAGRAALMAALRSAADEDEALAERLARLQSRAEALRGLTGRPHAADGSDAPPAPGVPVDIELDLPADDAAAPGPDLPTLTAVVPTRLRAA